MHTRNLGRSKNGLPCPLPATSSNFSIHPFFLLFPPTHSSIAHGRFSLSSLSLHHIISSQLSLLPTSHSLHCRMLFNLVHGRFAPDPTAIYLPRHSLVFIPRFLLLRLTHSRLAPFLPRTLNFSLFSTNLLVLYPFSLKSLLFVLYSEFFYRHCHDPSTHGLSSVFFQSDLISK